MNRKRMIVVGIGACALIAFCTLVCVLAPIAVNKFCAVMTPTTEHWIGKAEPNGTQQAQADKDSVPEPYCSVIRHPDILPLWIGAVGTLLASGAALVTLLIIGAQTNALRRQNNMIMSKERARLRVDLKPFVDKEQNGFPATIVQAEVSIFGSSLASIRDTKFLAVLGSATDIEETIYWWPPIHSVPEVMRPNSDPIESFTFLHRTGTLLAGDEGLEDVKRGERFVYAVGAIHYSDIYEGLWAFRFKYRWKYHRFSDGEPFGGDWEKCGNPEDNGEYPDK